MKQHASLDQSGLNNAFNHIEKTKQDVICMKVASMWFFSLILIFCKWPHLI